MEITTTLNQVKYLIVEVLVTEETENKLKKKLKKHGAIYQGIKEIKSGGFWGKTYGIFRVLVPEENVIDFNNDEN